MHLVEIIFDFQVYNGYSFSLKYVSYSKDGQQTYYRTDTYTFYHRKLMLTVLCETLSKMMPNFFENLEIEDSKRIVVNKKAHLRSFSIDRSKVGEDAYEICGYWFRANPGTNVFHALLGCICKVANAKIKIVERGRAK